MHTVSVIFGTRPEAIKLCPLVLALNKSSAFKCKVCVTGQHGEMLQQVLDLFGVFPDCDLALMRPNQTLGKLTSRAIGAIDEYLERDRPDIVVVQGDTTTALAGALAAFYHRIPIAHVEAGLRTGNFDSPWPEEANRVLISRLTRWHFCPTNNNKANLLREGVPEDNIHVTGNTVIDALLMARAKLPAETVCARRRVLITGHRRENFGNGLENICHAILALAEEFEDTEFVYPVHRNPNVREPVARILVSDRLSNVKLLEPQGYLQFVRLMLQSYLILTDSGGIQEEAPAIGKPVLVMRNTTERQEAVQAGTVRLVGTNPESICSNVRKLLTDESEYRRMSCSVNPYGDGKACARIVEILKKG